MKEHNPIRAVIFDFNGTLFFDNDKHVKAWSILAKRIRGYGMSEQELHDKCNGMPNHEIVRYLSGKELPKEEVEAISQEKEAIYRGLCRQDKPRFHLVKGAQEVFDALQKAGIPFTIASASIKPNIDFFVESFDLAKWFDPDKIQYDNGIFPDKTHMLLESCQVLGVNPMDVTVIEDSLAGVNAAMNAGMEDIRIINSAHTPQRFQEMGVERIGEDLLGLHLLEDIH